VAWWQIFKFPKILWIFAMNRDSLAGQAFLLSQFQACALPGCATTA